MAKRVGWNAARAFCFAAGALYGGAFPAATVQAGALPPGLELSGNQLTVHLFGSGNMLKIDQTHLQGGPSNELSLTISGDRNGGADQSSVELAPGQLGQSGLGNSAVLTINGSHNLFAMVQQGTGNSIVGHVTGEANLAIVAQAGTGNRAVFSQNGQGNSVRITQSTW